MSWRTIDSSGKDELREREGDHIEAAMRLSQWMTDYGHEKQPAFIRDLSHVLAFVLAGHAKNQPSPPAEGNTMLWREIHMDPQTGEFYTVQD